LSGFLKIEVSAEFSEALSLECGGSCFRRAASDRKSVLIAVVQGEVFGEEPLGGSVLVDEENALL